MRIICKIFPFILLTLAFVFTEVDGRQDQAIPFSHLSNSDRHRIGGNQANEDEVVCPGGEYKCPAHTTCCPLERRDFWNKRRDSGSNTEYGCCPMEDAVCCSDCIHCCPNGTTCDLTEMTCVRKNSANALSIPLQRKVQATKITKKDDIKPSVSIQANEDEVVCPGGEHKCPAHTTCCPLERRDFWYKRRNLGSGSNTDYGCCPEEDAVCCSDHKHCCPHGTTCDIEQKTCNALFTPLQKKLQAKKIKDAIKTTTSVTICSGAPNGQFAVCQSGNCCVKMRDQNVITSCCPFKNGQCCSTNHCCPSGFRCSETEGECIGESDGILFTTALIGAHNTILLDGSKSINQCPDGTYCPKGNKCCPTPADDNGKISHRCCPSKNGSCCESGQVCCPYGYECDGRKNCKKIARVGNPFIRS